MKYLEKLFNKVRQKNEKWHQFARFVLTPTSEWQYMYDRLVILLQRHRKSHLDYFKPDTTLNYSLPDMLDSVKSIVDKEFEKHEA